MRPFDHNKFIGYVCEVTPQYIRLQIPSAKLLRTFYFDGEIYFHGASLETINSSVRRRVNGGITNASNNLDVYYVLYDIVDLNDDNPALKLSKFEHDRIQYHFAHCHEEERVQHDNSKYAPNTKKGKYGVYSFQKWVFFYL